LRGGKKSGVGRLCPPREITARTEHLKTLGGKEITSNDHDCAFPDVPARSFCCRLRYQSVDESKELGAAEQGSG
jgi:hypothetical protein